MKGLIALFLALSIFGVAWGYADSETKKRVRSAFRKNAIPVAFAILAAAAAAIFSVNSTVRFL